jgi:hypothetical protein
LEQVYGGEFRGVDQQREDLASGACAREDRMQASQSAQLGPAGGDITGGSNIA